MPPSGYLTATGIESCLQYLATAYPSICQLIPLPEQSREGRVIRGLRIASSTGQDRHGILFIGGVHARELVNPDTLVGLALKLCQAYSTKTGLTFGGKTYSSGVVRLIVDGLDIYILPLVNPDGREYVQSPTGDPWWRKNRSTNAGLPCAGVDINRNFDFLWSSVIGMTSADPCNETFHGPSAFSEPETRNVRWMLDAHPNIQCMMDVHSYSRLVLHPWGDDEVQTTSPSMTFRDPVYSGLRGVVGDTTYREYMPAGDRDWFVNSGNVVRDAIAAAHGNVYTVEQAIYLYPTSGTSKDYAYSRHFVDLSKRKVYAYTLETGVEFQPAFPGAVDVMDETMAGLVQFSIRCLCVAEALALGNGMSATLVDLRGFRDERLLAYPTGRRWVRLLEENTAELLEILSDDPRAWKDAVSVFRRVAAIVAAREDQTPKVFDDQLLGAIKQLAARLSQGASPRLQKSLREVTSGLSAFRKKTVSEALPAAATHRATQAKRRTDRGEG